MAPGVYLDSGKRESIVNSVIKIERHYTTLFCQSVTEINRYFGPHREALKLALDTAKDLSRRNQSKRDRQIFYMVTVFNDQLKEWVNPTIFENGYEK